REGAWAGLDGGWRGGLRAARRGAVTSRELGMAEDPDGGCAQRAADSVELQSDRFDDRRPPGNVFFHETPEFLGARIDVRFETRLDEHLPVGRLGDHRSCFLPNLFEYRLRCTPGIEQADRLL